MEAVKGLSLFFDENNINTRRYLRSNLEKRSLVYNEKFLACFGEAKKVIDSLYSDVNLMNESCQQIKYKLSVNFFCIKLLLNLYVSFFILKANKKSKSYFN